MDNMNFEYKVSVIVPVYNVEQYLRDCLDSLLAQTIDHDEMEVLLINDGSTDKSLEICKEYEMFFPCLLIFSQENKGVSAARNVGIKNARGKYILFLDSDDTSEPQTLKQIVDFFDDHYNEINLVTYYDRYFINEKEVSPHLRYKYLTKTGIYSLRDNVFALQLRLSICYKNQFSKNILFAEGVSFQEDQKFCCELLKDDLKIGYVKEAVYNYIRNDTGLVASASYPLYSFESSIAYFEELFDNYRDNEIPEYYQDLFIHDISWKFAETVLYPYHYNDHEFKIAEKRIVKLLDKVSNRIIMSYPQMDNYQKLYWIRKKTVRNETLIFEPEQIMLMSGVDVLYKRSNVEIILKRVVINEKKIKIVGYFKSPFFSYTDDFKLLVNVNGEISELDVIPASSSYYKFKEKTDNFYSLIWEKEILEDSLVEFFVKFSDRVYPTVYWNSNTTSFYNGFLKSYSAGKLKLTQEKNGFRIAIIDAVNTNEILKNSINEVSKKVTDEEIKRIRNIYILLLIKKYGFIMITIRS